ncbi:ionic transporter y4hA [Blastococcus sp. KM273129]|nr:ionic transporter y4hA [Blastococcus sp. KM273129]
MPTAGTPAASPAAGLPARLARWATVVVPLLAVGMLAAVWGRPHLSPLAQVAVACLLAGSVLAAVHHAEMVALRVGEPFGSLILAVAVTIIEVGLIVSVMLSGGPGTDSLARDTVFAAVMLTCNGIVGLALLIGALRHGVARFNAEGTGAALATVLTLAALCLVLPTFTISAPGPTFTPAQLVFAAVVSLALYGLFVFVQNIRHRDYFLPPRDEDSDEFRSAHRRRRAGEHAAPPSTRSALTSLLLLMAALIGVVGLAKVESKTIEEAVTGAGLPASFVGVIIAVLVLLPETLAAVRNARRDRVQISLNLALGSAMASIGLTIPTIAVASFWLPGPLLLGLGPLQIALLVLTAAVGVLTVMPGRSTLLQAAVHLVLCAAFLFLAANP